MSLSSVVGILYRSVNEKCLGWNSMCMWENQYVILTEVDCALCTKQVFSVR